LASERFGLGKGWSKPSSPKPAVGSPVGHHTGLFLRRRPTKQSSPAPVLLGFALARARATGFLKTRKLFRCPGLSGTKVPLAALRLAHTRGCTSPCATQTATRMKTALLVLFFVATASPVLANSEITCETVRAYVRQVGFVQAKAQARAAGMTATQERRASRCFTKTD